MSCSATCFRQCEVAGNSVVPEKWKQMNIQQSYSIDNLLFGFFIVCQVRALNCSEWQNYRCLIGQQHWEISSESTVWCGSKQDANNLLVTLSYFLLASNLLLVSVRPTGTANSPPIHRQFIRQFHSCAKKAITGLSLPFTFENKTARNRLPAKRLFSRKRRLMANENFLFF